VELPGALDGGVVPDGLLVDGLVLLVAVFEGLVVPGL
jgi:hypothetical protein